MHSKPIDVQHLSLNAHGISHVYTVLIPVLDPPEVPIAECWSAHLQLFYTCNDYTHGPDELQTTPYKQHQRAKFPHGSTDSSNARTTVNFRIWGAFGGRHRRQ